MKLPKITNANEIILVDDNEMEHLIVQRCFEQSGSKRKLVHFDNGNDFISYMDNISVKNLPIPALVLLDIMMPGMSGFEVLKEIRKNEKFATIPIIVLMSNSDAPSDIKLGIQLGADSYQTKSDGIKGLQEVFHQLLELE